VKLKLVAAGPFAKNALQNKLPSLTVGSKVIAQGILNKQARGANSHTAKCNIA
jgi:hypothetical protein